MENRTTGRKIKLSKLIKSKRRSVQHDKYHRYAQECVAEQPTDGYQIGLESKQEKQDYIHKDP